MSNRLLAFLIFCLSLWSFAAVAPQNPYNDQIVTRIGLASAIVDSGRLEIDRVAPWTVDKASFGGHFYADKAPGHPLLAVPVVAAAKLVREALGLTTDAARGAVIYDYARWATLVVNCTIAAAAAVVLFLAAIGLGASRAGAVFAAFALSLGTPFFGWSTAFFAHSVSGSFLLFALALVLGRAPMLGGRAVGLGLVLGYGCVIDLTAAPPLALIGLLAVVRGAREGSPARALFPLLLGGPMGLAPLPIYNQLAFGSPFHLGYENTAFTGMSEGLFGVTWPRADVFLQLLIGPYRGLLPLAPVLLLVPFGLVAMARDARTRPAAIVVALIVAYYFWLNSSYFYWNGGLSTGPRQLVPLLPPAALALAFAWPAGAAEKAIALALLAVSLVLSLACTLAGMFAPDTMLFPLTEFVLPRVLDPVNDAAALLVVPAWLAFTWLLLRAGREAIRKGSVAGPPAWAEQTGQS
jgi:hypothetical protein